MVLPASRHDLAPAGLALGEADPVAAQVLHSRTARHALGVVGSDDLGGASGERSGMDGVDVVDEQREVRCSRPVAPLGVVEKPEQEELSLPHSPKRKAEALWCWVRRATS